MISIFALIYASTNYADAVFASLKTTTPELASGEAEFFFVANNASGKVKAHLRARDYPHIVHDFEREPVPPDIFRSDKFDYMIDVYRGWNEGILQADGDVILPVNSDHVFFDGWLTELIKVWTPGRALSPVMIEPNEIRLSKRNGTGSLHGPYGRSPREFDIDAFKSHCEKNYSHRLTRGGCYMPCMILKQVVLDVGLFRPGNIDLDTGIWKKSGYPADIDMFAKLKQNGIDHQTCWTSFCYHFMEGELREWQSQTSAL